MRASADGSVVVGSSGSYRAFLWTRAGGMVDLGMLPGATTAYSTDVSDDGSIVVGTVDATEGARAFRWTSAGGMVSLGLPLDGGGDQEAYNTYGTAVSGDGAVVVGVLMSPDHAMLWTPSLGMVDLNTYFAALHLDLTGWTLTTANGVSLDGRTIVGTGTHNGLTEAWVAELSSSTAISPPGRRGGPRSRPVFTETGAARMR